jgi:predicted DNA-binding transcriptional regulator AlpA
MARDRHGHHLELLSGPALAGLLRISTDAFRRKRRELPSPVRIGSRRFWIRSEIDHLLPRRRYSDTVMAGELAGLLHRSVDGLYRLVRAGIVPPPTRVECRSVWSRKGVERHLAALPRD